MEEKEQKEELKKQFLKDFYIKFWELLYNAKLNQSILVDKYIFYFSAVGIGFSLKLALEVKYYSYKYLIICGIALLVLSTILSLISILLSQRGLDKQINDINQKIEELLDVESSENKEENKGNFSLVEKFNIGSLVVLVVGLFLILLFFGFNYISQEGREVAKKNTEQNEFITEIQQPQTPEKGKIFREGFTSANLPKIPPSKGTRSSQSTNNETNNSKNSAKKK
jgi:hypothetical protein